MKQKPAPSPQTELFKALLALKTPEECQKFFVDLCTPSELIAMAERWKVAQLVEQEIPYRKINELTGVSTATITRVARSLDYGSGGYRLALGRVQSKQKK